MTLHTYVNFPGTCEQALRFYEAKLGGKITALSRFSDQPSMAPPPGLGAQAIMHARIVMGGATLMASDGPADRVQPMRSAYLSLTLDTNEEAERTHAVLAEGGEIFMPLQETFFAHRFSMLRDRFGVNWMILHPKPMAA